MPLYIWPEYFMNYSWTIIVHVQFLKILHELQFMKCSWISSSGTVHEPFMNKCSWTVHVPSLKIVHELKQLHELGHFMFKDSSWTVHELVFMNSSCTILENYSWTIVHEIFTNSKFMNSKFMNSKFMNFSNFMNLASVHEQFMYHPWKLFMNYSSWSIHEFKVHERKVHELKATSWTWPFHVQG